MFFSMPYLPEVSVNHAHLRSRQTGQPVLKKEVGWWKRVLSQKVALWADEQGIVLEPGKTVVIWLTANFPRQSGTRANGDNFLKYATDAIAAGFDTDDDVYVFLPRVRAVHYNQEESELIYEVIPNVEST